MDYKPDFEKIMLKYGRLFAHVTQKFEPEIREAAAQGLGKPDEVNPLEKRLSVVIASIFTLGYSKAMEDKSA